MAREILDTDTGELKREPEFIKLYIRNLCQAKGITGRQADMFHFMLSHMNDYNEVVYGKPSKDRFMAEHETTNATFNNNVSSLIKKGLIKRIGKGVFKVNPRYAVKVDWARVQKITWTTEYTEDGKSETVSWENGGFEEFHAQAPIPPEPEFEPEPTPPPTKPKAKKLKSYDWPKPEGVDQQHWDDWLQHRKMKRSPLSKTVMDKMEKEAEKAGWTMAQVIEKCASKPWIGFEAAWLDSDQRSSANTHDLSQVNYDVVADF